MPSESKQTEENDLSHDPQTTERNLGLQLDSPKNTQGYQGLDGEEVDTERRFNSVSNNVLYQNQVNKQKNGASIPLKDVESLPNEMLETSNRPLNLMSGHEGVLDDWEESKKEHTSPAAYVSPNQKTSSNFAY